MTGVSTTARLSKLATFIVTLLALLYPVWVFFAIQALSIWILALGLLCIAGLKLALAEDWTQPRHYLILLLVVVLCGLSVALGDVVFLKFYPALMNFSVALSFAYTLTQERSFIEQMVLRFQPEKLNQPHVKSYMRKLTGAWALFLTANGLMALYTAMFTSTEFWTLYNCVISYLLMASFFIGEIIFRQFYRRRWHTNGQTNNSHNEYDKQRLDL